MTKEIAIHNLFALKLRSRATSDREALEMAIKALEFDLDKHDEEVIKNTVESIWGEPCEDCISRADVLALAEKGTLVSNGNYTSVCKAINDLPSVTPKGVTITDFADRCRECGRIKPCEDCISREAVLDTEYQIKEINGIEYVMLSEVQMKIRKMPSVTPKQKVSEWIDMKYKDEWWCPVGKCLNCGEEHILGSNYCPNCGAKMEVESNTEQALAYADQDTLMPAT